MQEKHRSLCSWGGHPPGLSAATLSLCAPSVETASSHLHLHIMGAASSRPHLSLITSRRPRLPAPSHGAGVVGEFWGDTDMPTVRERKDPHFSGPLDASFEGDWSGGGRKPRLPAQLCLQSWSLWAQTVGSGKLPEGGQCPEERGSERRKISAFFLPLEALRAGETSVLESGETLHQRQYKVLHRAFERRVCWWPVSALFGS